ncbi:MAG: carbohydrate kinase, partial [Opitutales bacterium]|nr:carbohydrate kinase [Opitutales bacterium]
FDANLRQNFYSKDILLRSMEAADILKLSDEELPVISKIFSIGGSETECARAIFSMFNLSCVLLTCGKRGHVVVSSEGEISGKSKAGKIADTVGAGDSFTARFTCEILSGKSAAEAADLAAETAAQVCSRRGAIEI